MPRWNDQVPAYNPQSCQGHLKNEKAGQVVNCGGMHAVTLVEAAVEQREAQCIQDYKEQGFVRVPAPAK